MNMVKLADYLLSKYAAVEGDTSFGALINPEKTRILKDKLILVYDKINQKITRLPAFQELNKDFAGDPILKEFNNIINHLVVNIEELPLKEGFSYSIHIIKALNELRTSLRFRGDLHRDKKAQMDRAIKNVQDTLWEESKRILNIHDLRGLELEYPELKHILKGITPSWDYGPMKSPVRPLLRQQTRDTTTAKELMKRLMEEDKE